MKCCIKIQSMTTLLVFFRQILTKCSFILLLEKAKNGLQSNNSALAWSKVKLHARMHNHLQNGEVTKRNFKLSVKNSCFVSTPRNKWKHEAECFYCFEVFGTPDETRTTSLNGMTSQSRLKIQCNKACKINVFPAGMVNSSCKCLPVFESRLSRVSSVLLHLMVMAEDWELSTRRKEDRVVFVCMVHVRNKSWLIRLFHLLQSTKTNAL